MVEARHGKFPPTQRPTSTPIAQVEQGETGKMGECWEKVVTCATWAELHDAPTDKGAFLGYRSTVVGMLTRTSLRIQNSGGKYMARKSERGAANHLSSILMLTPLVSPPRPLSTCQQVSRSKPNKCPKDSRTVPMSAACSEVSEVAPVDGSCWEPPCCSTGPVPWHSTTCGGFT